MSSVKNLLGCLKGIIVLLLFLVSLISHGWTRNDCFIFNLHYME